MLSLMSKYGSRRDAFELNPAFPQTVITLPAAHPCPILCAVVNDWSVELSYSLAIHTPRHRYLRKRCADGAVFYRFEEQGVNFRV